MGDQRESTANDRDGGGWIVAGQAVRAADRIASSAAIWFKPSSAGSGRRRPLATASAMASTIPAYWLWPSKTRSLTESAVRNRAVGLAGGRYASGTSSTPVVP